MAASLDFTNLLRCELYISSDSKEMNNNKTYITHINSLSKDLLGSIKISIKTDINKTYKTHPVLLIDKKQHGTDWESIKSELGKLIKTKNETKKQKKEEMKKEEMKKEEKKKQTK